MLTLGIEGTAHTTSASILDEKQIYSMVSRTYAFLCVMNTIRSTTDRAWES